MSSNKFYSIACKEINDIVKPLGFKKYKRFFYRITEEGVVQQFCLLWLNRTYTIRFRLSSIFNDNDRTCEGAEVYQIIDNSNEWISDVVPASLMYNLDENTYIQAVIFCKQILLERLLPFFEESSNIQTAHQYMLKYDSLVKDGKREIDIREIGFCLAVKEYDKAKDVLKHFIDNHDKWNKKWWGEKEKEYQDLYNAIVEKDLDYIEKYKNKKRKNTYSEFKWRCI